MQVGKIEQLTTEKPPRTMPHTFARQGEEIKRLQTELEAAQEKNLYLTEAHYTEYSRAETLLNWSRRAYNALDLIEPTADKTIVEFIRKIIAAAPEAVKGGDK